METKANVARRLFSLPINLNTLNEFFGKEFTENDARACIRHLVVDLGHEPRSFEEQATSSVGEASYNAVFEGYAQKQ